ncbi:MAG: aspartate aminotransferase family protein [Acidobacteria bacterium]|nr:aspartate aminotransferase family protein [Acidobacteriota bacterium]
MNFRNLSFDHAPSIRVTPPGPRSQEFLDAQASHEGSAVSYPRGMPMALQRGRGATVEDVDGNVYIDCFGGAGVMAVGHSHPAVVEAAVKQMGELTHALDFPTPARRKLVDALRPLLPQGLSRLFFGGPTGSDAVESAIKLAKLNTGRTPIIAFEGGYHGMTSGALAVGSGRQFKDRFLPLLPDVHFVPYAYCYRCAFGTTPDRCQTQCAAYLDHVLEDPHSGVSTPAAVIVEPIQGEGGSIVPPPEFLPKVREACDRHGVLLIADEIQAGFCRTGRMFAVEHTGTLPDIMTMSKALGGIGLPISAIAYREALNTWTRGAHIGTFRGHVVAYAAGAAALEFMVKEDLAAHSARLGGLMLDWLKEIARDSPFVGEARGKGLMIGVEFVKDKATRQPAPDLASRVRTLCHQHGLLIEIGGHYSNVARLLPPLVITDDLARKAVDILADAVRTLESS